MSDVQQDRGSSNEVGALFEQWDREARALGLGDGERGAYVASRSTERLASLSDEEILAEFEAPPGARVDRAAIGRALVCGRRVIASARRAMPRQGGRAPRRAARRAAAGAKVTTTADQPPEPPHLVEQHDGGRRLGLSSRAFVAFVKKHDIPFAQDGRRYLVRWADVEARLVALGLTASPDVEAPAPKWSADRVVLRLMKGGGK